MWGHRRESARDELILGCQLGTWIEPKLGTAQEQAMTTGNLPNDTQYEGRRVLIIGGAGYIGSMLTRRLLNNGCRVRVLDSLIYGHVSSLSGIADNPNFEFVRGDLCDGPKLTESMRSVTDVVLLAALVGDPICKKYPDVARKVNEVGAIAVIDEAEHSGVQRLVFTSTCSNYGILPTDEEANEDATLNPQSLYAETKIAVERHLLSKPKGLCARTILRVATAFGTSERMRFDLTVSEFSRELALGRSLLVYDESTWRPYCHVQDLCTAIITVLNAPRKSVDREVFNVGSSRNNFTKQMLVDVIVSQLGVSSALVTYKKGGQDPRNYRVAFDKIQKTLDFHAAHAVEDGVAQLSRAIRQGLFLDADERRSFYGNYEIVR
jgi:nucleoside-diphosphate-sugar epimerase